MRGLHRKRKMHLITKFLNLSNRSPCLSKNKGRGRESQMLRRSTKKGCMMSQWLGSKGAKGYGHLLKKLQGTEALRRCLELGQRGYFIQSQKILIKWKSEIWAWIENMLREDSGYTHTPIKISNRKDNEHNNRKHRLLLLNKRINLKLITQNNHSRLLS